MINMEKIQLLDTASGFTERDKNSKAILNTDMDGLLKYKIQRRKMVEINKNANEIHQMRVEVNELKTDLAEIKSLLMQITKR